LPSRIYVVLEHGITDLHPPGAVDQLIEDGTYHLWWGTSPQRIHYTASNGRRGGASDWILLNWPVQGAAPIYSGFLHAGHPRGVVTLDHEDVTIRLESWCDRRGLIRLQPTTEETLRQLIVHGVGEKTAQIEIEFANGSIVEAARAALGLRIWA
jgi:hypothetical protein